MLEPDFPNRQRAAGLASWEDGLPCRVTAPLLEKFIHRGADRGLCDGGVVVGGYGG